MTSPRLKRLNKVENIKVRMDANKGLRNAIPCSVAGGDKASCRLGWGELICDTAQHCQRRALDYVYVHPYESVKITAWPPHVEISWTVRGKKI